VTERTRQEQHEADRFEGEGHYGWAPEIEAEGGPAAEGVEKAFDAAQGGGLGPQRGTSDEEQGACRRPTPRRRARRASGRRRDAVERTSPRARMRPDGPRRARKVLRSAHTACPSRRTPPGSPQGAHPRRKRQPADRRPGRLIRTPPVPRLPAQSLFRFRRRWLRPDRCDVPVSRPGRRAGDLQEYFRSWGYCLGRWTRREDPARRRDERAHRP
jgi:hypothetical protein